MKMKKRDIAYYSYIGFMLLLLLIWYITVIYNKSFDIDIEGLELIK